MSTEGIQELTREQIRERIDLLMSKLGPDAERRLNEGDFDDEIISSEIRMLRFLLDEQPELQHAAE